MNTRKATDWPKLLSIASAVVLAWVVVSSFAFARPSWIRTRLGWEATAETGQFGDTFGAVNSLFSALGLAGVAMALFYQSRERQEAAEASAKEAELAILTALIHGRAASLISTAIENLVYQLEFERLSDRDLVQITNIHQVMGSAIARRDAEQAEVSAILKYAEEMIGWNIKKTEYSSTPRP